MQSGVFDFSQNMSNYCFLLDLTIMIIATLSIGKNNFFTIIAIDFVKEIITINRVVVEISISYHLPIQLREVDE